MISGSLYKKIGPRLLAVVEMALATISLIGFTRLEVTTTGADLQIWLVLHGLSLGMVFQPVQMPALSVVSRPISNITDVGNGLYKVCLEFIQHRLIFASVTKKNFYFLLHILLPFIRFYCGK